jgi:DNA polymerase III subunit delta
MAMGAPAAAERPLGGSEAHNQAALGQPERAIHSRAVTGASSGDSAAIKPAYLIAGSDEGKIDAVLSRLRARAEREGGPGALETFGAADGSPDPEPLIAAIPSMSLMAARRYLLADGVERWSAKQATAVIEALGDLPPDLTVALVAREAPPKHKAPKGLAEAVEGAGGEVLRYAAPKARDLPGRLVAEAKARGFRLDPAAARMLVERMGEGTMRLVTEIERLAVWAGREGEVTAEDLESMIVDTSEEATWALSDAVVARDRAGAVRASERLSSQGEAITPIVYQAARRLRDAQLAASELERGTPPKEVEGRLRMHPYAARMLVRGVKGTSSLELRAATCAVADLEWWTRGGSEYPDDVALTLAVLRAAGAGAGART